MGHRRPRSARGSVAAALLVVVVLVGLGFAAYFWGWPYATETEDLVPGSEPPGGLAREAWTVNEDQVTFAVVGDDGTGGRNQLRVAEQMTRTYQRTPYGLILDVGDLVSYGSLVDRFQEVVVRPFQPLLQAGVVIRPVLGGEEWDYTASLQALELQALPGRYYAFRSGPAEFFMLDSTPPRFEGDGGAAQLTWLDQRLAASTARWKIVALRDPPYSSGEDGSGPDIRQKLEPILAKHGVDVVFAGGQHHYERTTPQQGVVYVVAGAGSRLAPVGRSDFTAASAERLQFVLVDIKGTQLTGTVIAADGREIDRFTVEQAAA